MNDSFRDAMFEATQLTQAGRLADATVIIQRALGNLSGVAEASPDERDVIEGDFQVVAEGLTEVENRPDASDVMMSGGGMESDPLLNEMSDPGFFGGSYGNRAGSRDYRLYLPGHRAGVRQARPLIVMLHGCGQDPEDFATGTRMNQLAEEQGWVVLYPAQADSANLSGCWNWFNETDQQRDQGEPSIIADLTRQVMASHNIDPHRVYVAGLSAGGAMAATLAATYPDLYAAVGVHSGLPHGAARDMVSAVGAMRQGVVRSGWISPPLQGHPPPAIVFHGDCDTTVHPANALQVIAQACGHPACMEVGVQVRQGRIPGGYGFTHTRYQDAEGRARAELWLVHSAGHGWMGGDDFGTYAEPHGPDASREMLRFFDEHPRRDR